MGSIWFNAYEFKMYLRVQVCALYLNFQRANTAQLILPVGWDAQKIMFFQQQIQTEHWNPTKPSVISVISRTLACITHHSCHHDGKPNDQ